LCWAATVIKSETDPLHLVHEWNSKREALYVPGTDGADYWREPKLADGVEISRPFAVLPARFILDRGNVAIDAVGRVRVGAVRL